MKRLLVIVALVALFASTSFAGVQDFGMFTVDVPSGWTASMNGPTAVFTKNDNTASLSITVADTEGYSLADLANGFAEEFKKSFPQVGTPEKDSDGDYSFSMVNGNGVESNVLLTGDEGKYCLFAITGAENAPEDLNAMMSSVKTK
ncbi:MAG: hypothetical protein IJT20_07885 [Synergistaceae bacterium]|nr:hypothetical protein [Synergistaceae bacterium]